MKNIYIEFLKELYVFLEEKENTWWSKWMKRSIDKFNSNEDVSYFLGAFGGSGSFNDVYFDSEITEVLQTITYSCAYAIEKNDDRKIEDILLNEQERLNNVILYYQSEQGISSFNSQIIVERSRNELNYINTLIENYSIGNLHEITTHYLNDTKTKKI